MPESCMTAGELTADDLDALDKVHQYPSSLKRIRDHHHLIARRVAEGMRTTDIAREVGLSISRVSILKGDPAFKQLVETYRVNVNSTRDAVFTDIFVKMGLAYEECCDIILDRFAEDPDSVPTETIIHIMEHFADRIGLMKTTKNLSFQATAKLDGLADLVAARKALADRLSAENLSVEGPGMSPADLLPAPRGLNGG